MYKVEVHKRIHQVISLYHFMRIWNDYHPTDFRKRISDSCFLLIYLYYPVSVFGASFTSDTSIEAIYLAVLAITGVVMIVRLYTLMFKKDEIIELIHKMGVHSIKDREECDEINKKIEVFVKYSTFYHIFLAITLSMFVIAALPMISNEKQFPVKQYLTLNWRENNFVYWITYIFVAYELVLTFMSVLLNMIIWYLMMSCVIQYKVLGNEFKKLGLVTKDNIKKKKTSVAKNQDLFLVELIALIKSHRNLQEMTDQMKFCFSTLFLVQIGTSGINICCSVYNLAFNSTENLFLFVCYINVIIYQFFDIFMLTYYGNEIKFWSARLSYSLFESNWLNESNVCKKYAIILMEVLKRPQVLVIGKLYPLDLEIFTNILNFAYGTFNVLKNLSK